LTHIAVPSTASGELAASLDNISDDNDIVFIEKVIKTPGKFYI
jgi:hypothetical protein